MHIITCTYTISIKNIYEGVGKFAELGLKIDAHEARPKLFIIIHKHVLRFAICLLSVASRSFYIG